MRNNYLKIEKDKVLETIQKYPYSREVLESLFPEIKKAKNADKPFIKIGQPFIRRNVSIFNVYILHIQNNQVRVRNLTNDYEFKTLKYVDASTMSIQSYLSQSEFEYLMLGYNEPLLNFVPIPYELLENYLMSKGPRQHLEI